MLNKLRDNVDMSVLDEIIQLAEDAMVRPFSKKKPEIDVAVIGKTEDEDDMEESTDEESAIDMSDGDMDELLDEYKRMKGR